ncbi:MAG: saccharopine dehydrogenase NADP-binding domain-containing protein [Nanoarchaeota archaeon]|nr:saccharopine dehydrogenase NADP-binding domain-containing protein [Nanoarchaeota archaeon]
MGEEIARDLKKYGAVTAADYDPAKRLTAQKLGIGFEPIDVRDHANLVKLMRGYDGIISAVARPEYHLLGLEAAIDAKCNYTDLGADPDTLKKQLALHQKAKDAGIIAMPDNGICPGTVNILDGHGDSQLDITHYIHNYVGAIPLNPTNPPLNYTQLFSLAVLVSEYTKYSTLIKDGKVQHVKALSGLEKINFPGFGEMEADYVAGMSSTLTRTFEGQVQEWFEKTLRYPGHYQEIKKLIQRFPDKSELEDYLKETLPKNQKDVVLVKVVVGGIKDGQKTEITYTIAHEYNDKTNTTATAETTAWSVSIIAQMIASGAITQRGVLEQEKYVPREAYLYQIDKRGIKIKKEIITK